MKKILLFTLCAVSLFAEQEVDLLARIRNHLTIHDVDGAIREAKSSLEQFPESVSLRKAYLRALCEKGKETEALTLCRQLVDLASGEQENRLILETLAWGALQKGQKSEQLFVRLNALLGSAFTNDSRAIPALLGELRGSNAILRGLALKLSAQMGDEPLRKEILRLLKEEKVWYVRLSVLQAIGSLKMVEAKPLLEKIVSSGKTLGEERALAIITLASLYESISKEDLKKLIQSKRAGLRQLACEIVVYLDLKEFAEELEPLLHDPSPDLRIAALCVHALLEMPKNEATKMVLEDPVPAVAITAAWLRLRQGDKEGGAVLARFLSDPSSQARRLAAAAIASTGKAGVEIAKEHLLKNRDEFVRVNLALGLLRERQEVMKSCEVIAKEIAASEGDLWMWDQMQNPVFRVLSPSRVRHIEQIPNYPAIVDQLTRLDLLGMLSILQYPYAIDAVKAFLKQGRAELVGAAAGTLIQEMDEEGVIALRGLLEDPEEEVRVEAALILAMWGREGSGVDVLIRVYPKAPRERKIQILEALGRSGDPRAVPFLFDVLGEPFQVLRIVAASSLIQCLYR